MSRSSGRNRSKSPTRSSGQPKTFQPSSGTSALYGGASPNSPSSLGQQISPGSMNFVNQFFSNADQTGLGGQKISPTNEFWRQPVLAQPTTFQPSLTLSGRRQQQPNAVMVMSPQQSSCVMTPKLSPGTVNMMNAAFGCSDQTGFPQNNTSSIQPATFSPRLL
jgi:hypothetical protein